MLSRSRPLALMLSRSRPLALLAVLAALGAVGCGKSNGGEVAEEAAEYHELGGHLTRQAQELRRKVEESAPSEGGSGYGGVEAP